MRTTFLLLLVVGLLTGSDALAMDCKALHARYASKLKAARSESGAYRKATLNYLSSLEAAFAKCFTSEGGKALVAERKAFEKAKPPALRRKVDPKDKDDPAPPQKRIDLSSGSSSSVGGGWSGGGRRRLHPASAAMLSLMMPGVGQAVANKPLAGWLFFLGANTCYGIAGGLVGTAFDAKKSKWDNGQLTAALVFGILGGVVHISSIIHAAASK